MKTSSRRNAACCLLLWLFSLPLQALEVVDDTGRLVHLDRDARRVITLSPHATELVFAAGAGEKLVAVVAHSDYPAAARRLPSVGDATRLDRERILALRPDLVIAWDSGNREKDLAWLNRAGVAVYRSEPRRLEHIPLDMERIGLLAGTAAAARENAARFRRRLEELRRRYGKTPPVRVFYQLWPRPLMTVGGGHIISEVLRLCGGVNLFSRLPALAARVSREAVILANPQAIIAAADPGAPDPLGGWRRWSTVAAVKSGRLYRIEADLIHRQSPRILDGAEQVCEALAQAGPGLPALDRQSTPETQQNH